ncbi:hypothetical protein VTK26DRAFT_5714 [Humicola hyalothermophila]
MADSCPCSMQSGRFQGTLVPIVSLHIAVHPRQMRDARRQKKKPGHPPNNGTRRPRDPAPSFSRLEAGNWTSWSRPDAPHTRAARGSTSGAASTAPPAPSLHPRAKPLSRETSSGRKIVVSRRPAEAPVDGILFHDLGLFTGLLCYQNDAVGEEPFGKMPPGPNAEQRRARS